MGSLQGSFQAVPAKVFTAHNLSLKLFLPYSSYLRIYNINQTYTTNNNISRLLLPKGWDLILVAVATWLVARVNQFNTLDYSTIKYFVNSPCITDHDKRMNVFYNQKLCVGLITYKFIICFKYFSGFIPII